MAMASPHRRIVGVSTKMYFSASCTKSYIETILDYTSAPSGPSLLDQVDIFIIPDHIAITDTVSRVRSANSKIIVGAQDCFWEDSGSFTGEISPAVLSEIGCRIVEVGHAERRRIFGETDEATAKKAAATARNGMTPLVCIGERTQATGETGIMVAVDECKIQVEAVMAALPAEAEVILAYEPVWAIGAAEPAGAEYVVDVTRRIRSLECVQKRKGTTRILYGGSAGPGLFGKLKDGVDGLFLGRFAHDPSQFYKTITEVVST